MKPLYLLLFILSVLSIKAQNWQAVYSDRLVFFDNSLQAIKIVSIKVDSAGDSTFKNYPQFLMDSIGITERIYGRIKDSTSWIGRRIHIKNNGYNGFVNDSNETIWLNTLAGINDTFTFFDNKKVLIKGYCNKILYADTLGIIDSVKQFKFIFNVKPGFNFKFDTTRLKEFEILLSKHYGLLQTPAFGGIWFSTSGTLLYEPFQIYSTKNYFTNRRFNDFDIGDEYEYKIKNDYQRDHIYENRYYYQVTGKENVSGTDSIKYTFLVRRHLLHTYKAWVTTPNPTVPWYWETETKHFVYNETKTLPVNDEPVNGWLPWQVELRDRAFFNKVFHIWDSCDLMIEDLFFGHLIDTIDKFIQPPFEHSGGKDYHSRIGYLEWFLDGSTGSSNPVGEQYHIYYRNFCNTQIGTPWAKYYVYGVGIDEVESKEDVAVYPNPAQNIVSVQANQIQSVKLLDINGKEIPIAFATQSNGATADISALENGMYFIVTETAHHQRNLNKLLIFK